MYQFENSPKYVADCQAASTLPIAKQKVFRSILFARADAAAVRALASGCSTEP